MEQQVLTPREIAEKVVREVGSPNGRAMLDRWCNPDMLDHRPDDPAGDFAGMLASIEALKANAAQIRSVVDETMVEGDLVFVRWTLSAVAGTTHPRTGEPIAFTGMTLFRFDSGLIVERWVNRNEVPTP